MTITRRKVLWLFAVLVLLGISYWCYENFTIEEIRFPSSLKGEAVRNDLLAAERLATALGADAQSVFGYRQLPAGPAASAVLILPTQRRTLLPRQREELLQWVAAGGHLIVVTYTLEGESQQPDVLLSSLGVLQYYTAEGRRLAPRKPGPDGETVDESDADKAARRNREMLRRMQQYGPPRPLLQPDRKDCTDQIESGTLAPRFMAAEPHLRVCFDIKYRLETTAEKLWAVTSRHGTHALTVGHGTGKVTVLTDYEFMRNTRIGHADHADLFAAMLGFNDPVNPPRSVLLIPREDVDSIFLLTWKYAWTVVLVLVAWLLLALWRAGSRFGPLLPVRILARRSLAEHVRASGEFLWRHGESAQLWRATLALTQRQIERVLPSASYPSRELHLDALAQRSGIAAAQLDDALKAKYPPAAEKFSTTIATLDQLRKSL